MTSGSLCTHPDLGYEIEGPSNVAHELNGRRFSALEPLYTRTETPIVLQSCSIRYKRYVHVGVTMQDVQMPSANHATSANRLLKKNQTAHPSHRRSTISSGMSFICTCPLSASYTTDQDLRNNRSQCDVPCILAHPGGDERLLSQCIPGLCASREGL